MTTKTYPIIGTKSSLLWDEDTDAWVYISGRPELKEDPRSYYRMIPTLYRAVDIRANSIANLPWALMRGEDEFETSQDYQNKTGLVSNMTTMLYLIEASLVLAGVSYWKREQNMAGYNKLRHLDPASLQLDEKSAVNGELVWKRNANNKTVEYTEEDIIYVWYPDPFVEIGPPSSWPTKAALNACGVLANMDEFAKNYFGRGAIKAMIFSMSGASQSVATEFETWWSRFVTGIQNAFRTKVLNAEKVEPVIVGEGIKELENVTLSQEKREEIAIAMAIPMSILFANAANYATAQQDKLNWYDDKIVPEANLIASILNEQVFDALGLRLVFKPETLDIYQEDEAQRAQALSQFMDAIIKAGDIELAKAGFITLGYEIPKDAMAMIEAHFNAKAKRAEQLTQQMSQPAQENEPDEDEDDDEAPPVRNVDLQQMQAEVSRWQSKVVKAVKRGEPASSIDWVPVAIPAENYDFIIQRLNIAESVEDVKAAFVDAFRDGDETPFKMELDKFQRYAVNRINGGEWRDFESDIIPAGLLGALNGSLEMASSTADAKMLFKNALAWEGYP